MEVNATFLSSFVGCTVLSCALLLIVVVVIVFTPTTVYESWAHFSHVGNSSTLLSEAVMYRS
jgi:hypothetical protein